jgi:hypothetical protein
MIWAVILMASAAASAAAEAGSLTIDALLKQQAANISRVYNGTFTGRYGYWMDYAKKTGNGPNIREYETQYETIKVIGPPGGYARYDELQSPLKVNGQLHNPGWKTDRQRVQNYFDTKHLLQYQPDAKFAQVLEGKATSTGTWMEMHPLFYGLTYQGRTLEELREGLPNVKIATSGAAQNQVSLEFQGSQPSGDSMRIVVTLDTDKDLFISGYDVYRNVPGQKEEMMVEQVKITPAEGPDHLWLPAKVLHEYFQGVKDSPSGETSKTVSRQIEFQAVELNRPDMTPKDLEFTMADGTRVIDQNTHIQYRIGESLELAQDVLKKFADSMNVPQETPAAQSGAIAPADPNAGKTLQADAPNVHQGPGDATARIFTSRKSQIGRILLWISAAAAGCILVKSVLTMRGRRQVG